MKLISNYKEIPNYELIDDLKFISKENIDDRRIYKFQCNYGELLFIANELSITYVSVVINGVVAHKTGTKYTVTGKHGLNFSTKSQLEILLSDDIIFGDKKEIVFNIIQNKCFECDYFFCDNDLVPFIDRINHIKKKEFDIQISSTYLYSPMNNYSEEFQKHLLNNDVCLSFYKTILNPIQEVSDLIKLSTL